MQKRLKKCSLVNTSIIRKGRFDEIVRNMSWNLRVNLLSQEISSFEQKSVFIYKPLSIIFVYTEFNNLPLKNNKIKLRILFNGKFRSLN